MKKLSILILLSLPLAPLAYGADSNNTLTSKGFGAGSVTTQRKTAVTTQPTEATGLATLASATPAAKAAKKLTMEEAYTAVATDVKKAMVHAEYIFEGETKTKHGLSFKKGESIDPTRQNFSLPAHIFSGTDESWDDLVVNKWLQIVGQLTQKPGTSTEQLLELARLKGRIEALSTSNFAEKENPAKPVVTVEKAIESYSARMKAALRSHFTKPTITQDEVDAFAATIAFPFEQACKEVSVDPKNTLIKQYFTPSASYKVDFDATQIEPSKMVLPAGIKAFAEHAKALKPAFWEHAFTKSLTNRFNDAPEYTGANHLQDERTGDRIQFSPVNASRMSKNEANKIACTQAIAEISNSLLCDLTKIKDNLPIQLANVAGQISVLELELQSKQQHAFLNASTIEDLQSKLILLKREYASLKAQSEIATSARLLQKNTIIQLATNHGEYGKFNLPPTITLNAWTQSSAKTNTEDPNKVFLTVAHEIIAEQKKAEMTRKEQYFALIASHLQTLAKRTKYTSLFTGTPTIKGYDFGGSRILLSDEDRYENPYNQKGLTALECAIMAERKYEKTARLVLPKDAFDAFTRQERQEKLALCSSYGKENQLTTNE